MDNNTSSTIDSADVAAPVQVWFSGSLLTSLDDWRRRQTKIPPRSIALRTLVEKALAADGADRAAS